MKKRIWAALLALCALGGAANAQEEGAAVPPMIRLHVIAASDSAQDQEEKLTVRDAVLAEARLLLAGCGDYTEAYHVLDERLADVERAAREALPARVVHAELTREHYPDRIYGAMVVPAGEYTSLKVVIGAGAGRNWWCVVYPTLCADALTGPGGSAVRDDAVSTDTGRAAQEVETGPGPEQTEVSVLAVGTKQTLISIWQRILAFFLREEAAHG